MTQAAAVVLEHLERSGIRYCLIHGWDKPESEGDVDIACAPRDFPRLEEALTTCAAFSCLQLLQHESSCYYFILAVIRGESTSLLKLDVATDYRRNGRVFLAAEELLEGRRKLEGIWVSSPRAEFSYLLTKKILKGAFPDRQRSRLEALLLQLGREAEEAADLLLGSRTAGKILSLISAGEWPELERALPRAKKSLRRTSFLRRPLSVPLYWLSEVRRIGKRLNKPTGLSVAVMGSDGSGKSTLARSIMQSTAAAFRSGTLYHLRPGLLAHRANAASANAPHGRPPYSRLLSLLKLLHFTADYHLGHFLIVRPKLRRSTLIVFDRYYHDILVDPLRYRYAGPQWLARAAARLVPAPGIFIFLDAPREALLARKQELPPDEIIRQRGEYIRLAAGLPNAILLDGSLPPETAALHAREAILRCLGERYRSRRRGSFPANRPNTRWIMEILGGQTGGKHAAKNSHALLSLPDGRGFLLPLGNGRSGVRSLELYKAQNIKSRGVKTLISLCMRAGVTPPFLQKIPLRESPLFRHLEELLGERGLDFAVSLGTPGLQRKPVIQAIGAKGDLRAYVKVGWNRETERLVLNEAEILRELESRPSPAFAAPRVLLLESRPGSTLLVQEAPKGKTTDAPRALAPFLPALSGFQRIHDKSMTLQESAFWAGIRAGAERAAHASFGTLMHRGIRILEETFASKPIPFHLIHGDFTPWNAVWRGKKPFFFDWEHARREGPVGYDAFHFLYSTWTLLDGRSAAWIHDAVVGGTCREAIGGLFGSRGIGWDHVRPLFLAYILDRLSSNESIQWGHFFHLTRLATLTGLLLSDWRLMP